MPIKITDTELTWGNTQAKGDTPQLSEGVPNKTTLIRFSQGSYYSLLYINNSMYVCIVYAFV